MQVRSVFESAHSQHFHFFFLTTGAAVTVNCLQMPITSPHQDSCPWQSDAHSELYRCQQAEFLCFFSFPLPISLSLTLSLSLSLSARSSSVLYCLWANSQAQNPCQCAVCTIQPLLPSWSQVTSNCCSWGGFRGLKVKGGCRQMLVLWSVFVLIHLCQYRC